MFVHKEVHIKNINDLVSIVNYVNKVDYEYKDFLVKDIKSKYINKANEILNNYNSVNEDLLNKHDAINMLAFILNLSEKGGINTDKSTMNNLPLSEIFNFYPNNGGILSNNNGFENFIYTTGNLILNISNDTLKKYKNDYHIKECKFSTNWNKIHCKKVSLCPTILNNKKNDIVSFNMIKLNVLYQYLLLHNNELQLFSSIFYNTINKIIENKNPDYENIIDFSEHDFIYDENKKITLTNNYLYKYKEKTSDVEIFGWISHISPNYSYIPNFNISPHFTLSNKTYNIVKL
jgi:hypothetical protein